MSKTTNLKIEGIELKISQLENERKRLVGLQKAADRKARTKRLIERGAILESFITNPASYTNNQIKLFLEKTITSETARKILTEVKTQNTEIDTLESKQNAKPIGVAPSNKPVQMAMET
jgi:outer membrane murein-binding lipoprotein Lpp